MKCFTEKSHLNEKIKRYKLYCVAGLQHCNAAYERCKLYDMLHLSRVESCYMQLSQIQGVRSDNEGH